MPTYAQLQAESWWGREIIPQPLKDLGARLSGHYNRPATAAGTKGDNVHLSGSHRSQEWIKRSRWCTNRSYTVQSGLTATQARYIAGFDFNPGSEARMIEICSRLDRAVRAGTLEQVREWYGNDDGDNRVDGYNNVANRVATSDASHLWHLHLTFDRRLVNSAASVKAVGDVLLGVGSGSTGGTSVPVPSGSPMLRVGSTGTAVRQLQTALNEATDAELKVDGDFGTATESAVKAFQRSARLDDDGIYGSNTAAALREELSMPTAKEVAAEVKKELIDFLRFEVDADVWAGQGTGRLAHGTYSLGVGARNGWAYGKVNLAEMRKLASLPADVAELAGRVAGLTSLVQQLLSAPPVQLTPEQLGDLTQAVQAAAREPGERIEAALVAAGEALAGVDDEAPDETPA